jgi:hypothetical protein
LETGLRFIYNGTRLINAHTNHGLNGFGYKVWGHVLKASHKNSPLVKGWAIPLFLGTLVKEGVRTPCIIFEKLVVLVYSIFQSVFRRKSDVEKLETVNTILIGVFYLPAVPVIALAEAVLVAASFVLFPKQTAKAALAKQGMIQVVYRFTSHEHDQDCSIRKRFAKGAYRLYLDRLHLCRNIDKVAKMKLEDMETEVTKKFEKYLAWNKGRRRAATDLSGGVETVSKKIASTPLNEIDSLDLEVVSRVAPSKEEQGKILDMYYVAWLNHKDYFCFR